MQYNALILTSNLEKYYSLNVKTTNPTITIL